MLKFRPSRVLLSWLVCTHICLKDFILSKRLEMHFSLHIDEIKVFAPFCKYWGPKYLMYYFFPRKKVFESPCDFRKDKTLRASKGSILNSRNSLGCSCSTAVEKPPHDPKVVVLNPRLVLCFFLLLSYPIRLETHLYNFCEKAIIKCVSSCAACYKTG